MASPALFERPFLARECLSLLRRGFFLQPAQPHQGRLFVPRHVRNCSTMNRGLKTSSSFVTYGIRHPHGVWGEGKRIRDGIGMRRSCSGFDGCRRYAVSSMPMCTSISLENERTEKEDGIHLPVDNTECHPPLMLYNTMQRQKELFVPKVAGKVSLYVCGVTAYDYSHIGHARVYVAFDVLFRYLKHVGLEVVYCRNFTDVDDKIIARAAQTGEDPLELSARFCREFQEDMGALGCAPPTVEPRVSTHLPQIVRMIEQIIENGYGYAVEGGDVYFAVDTWPDYGALSGRRLDDNRSGGRVAVDERKRNSADFALWKAAKPGEPSWDSPWGPGRPGWHIECSAMSAEHLGASFDIHGGGADLVFPHHENELAQSRAACSHAHVGYWVHNGFVTIEDEKMSKSLGNFFTIRDVLETYHPLALRYFLLATQYRSPINYSKRQLDNASDRVYYLYQTLADCDNVVEAAASAGNAAAVSPSPEAAKLAGGLRGQFRACMADDLHTGQAVAALSEPLKALNDLLHTKKGRKDKARLGSLRALRSEVEAVLNVLGLRPASGYQRVLDELKQKALQRACLSEDELAARLRDRGTARAAKDYARSDEIRQELAARGIMLMDGGDGTLWRPGVVADEDSSSAS